MSTPAFVFGPDLERYSAIVVGDAVTFTPTGKADLRRVLDRALNTWEDRPAWLVELADYLNGVTSS